MEYQELVENIRDREDFFARWTGGWHGHYGPACSLYPNLAAELVARTWEIGTPANAAEVSREVLAGAIEDGDMLDGEELRRIADRMAIPYRYLCSPVLALVEPSTNKGRYRAFVLRQLVESAVKLGLRGVHIKNAAITLQAITRGIPVTYAAWRWACEETKRNVVQRCNEMSRTIRTVRRAAVPV